MAAPLRARGLLRRRLELGQGRRSRRAQAADQEGGGPHREAGEPSKELRSAPSGATESMTAASPFTHPAAPRVPWGGPWGGGFAPPTAVNVSGRGCQHRIHLGGRARRLGPSLAAAPPLSALPSPVTCALSRGLVRGAGRRPRTPFLRRALRVAVVGVGSVVLMVVARERNERDRERVRARATHPAQGARPRASVL